MNVPCPLCGDPLDRALRDAGFTTHPDCDPREVSAQWPPETAGDPAALPWAGTWRVLVTGSRDWPDDGSVEAALEAVAARHADLEVVHGDAGSGADFLAGFWARRQQRAGRSVWEAPRAADWQAPCREACKPGHRRRRRGGGDFCPAAGNYRNQAMVDGGADECQAFFAPGAANTGTSDCVRRAAAAGIPVEPHGQVPPAIARLLAPSPPSCRLQEAALQDQETRA